MTRRNPYTIQEVKKMAIKKGGKCLSRSYENNKTKLEWQCEKKHKWQSSLANINRGCWCPKCGVQRSAKSKIKYSIRDLHRWAKSKGGLCRSSKYVTTHTKYSWECAIGHNWDATFQQIKSSNSWCPHCSSGLGERICKDILEQAFKTDFIKTRKLTWLRTKQNTYLELDGYSEGKKIAFEHQGQQHYNTKTHFIKTKSAGQPLYSGQFS
jgi:hypothetical protein